MAKCEDHVSENWNNAVSCLFIFKNGIYDIVRNEMDKLLKIMRESIPCNLPPCFACTITFDHKTKQMKSENCIFCNSWLTEIRKYQASPGSVRPWAVIEINVSGWSGNLWELARFFVPPSYAKDKRDSLEKCDAAFLLHVMKGCTFIKERLTRESLVAIEKVIDIRNKVMHFNIEKDDLNNLIQSMCCVLQDKCFKLHWDVCSKITESIKEIQFEKRTKIPSNGYEMLREYMNERHCQIKNILSEKTLPAGQQRDQLETSQKEIENMLQHVEKSPERQEHLKETVKILADLLPKIRSKLHSDVESVRAYLQDRYRENFLARVPLDPFRENTILKTDDIYINLHVTDSKHKNEVVRAEGKPLQYNDLFTTKQNSIMKRVVIEGEPGIGKTTWCRKFAQDWTRECTHDDSILKRFQLLFIIELREVGNEETLRELFSNRIFGHDANNRIYVEQALKYIEDHPANVLIILDGLDEYRWQSPVLDKLLKNEECLDVNLLITSRDWAVPSLQKYTHINKIARIQGFNRANRNKYIQMFLKNMNPDIDAEEISSTTATLLQDIKRINAADIMRVPLLLSFVCYIWYMKKDKDLPKQYTQIYTQILEWYHKTYEKKRKNRMSEPPGPGTSDKNYDALLKNLGKVAFLGMVAKEKEVLIFYPDDAEMEIGKENLMQARDMGLLVDSSSLVNKPGIASLNFPHKTFQEYLASYYISSSDSDILQTFLAKCDASQHIGAMENVVIFLCGLNSQMGIDVLNHLIRIQLISPTEKIKKKSLLLKCLSQMNVKQLRNSDKLFIEHFHLDSPLGAIESFGWMYDWGTIYNLMTLCSSSVKSIKLSHFRMIRYKDSMIVRPRYGHLIEKITGNVSTPADNRPSIQLYPMKEVVDVILHGIYMEDYNAWPGLILSLKELPCLNSLEISWCDFNTAQVEIPACKKLTNLRLDVIMMESNMWTGFIRSLANVQNLQDILFKQTDFEDATVTLPNIGSLRRIELDHIKMKDENWDIFLPSFRNLQYLKSLKLVVCVLGRSSVTFEPNNVLEHLQLERLQVDETKWPSLVESFQNLTRLKSLHMTGVEINQYELSLPILHSLEELKLSELTISDRRYLVFFESLKNQNQLKMLTISSCDLSATDATFPISDSIEALTLENIENNSDSWPSFLVSISNLRLLKDLNISSCILGNRTITLPEISQLQHLVLSNITLETCAWQPFISSLDAQRRLKSLKIESIYLGGSSLIFPTMPQLKDITVEQLKMDSKQWPSFLHSLNGCHSLEEIEIRHCDFGDSKVSFQKNKSVKAITLAGITMDISIWPNFLDSLKNLENLRWIEISLCDFGNSSPKIPHLEKLETLKILAVVVDASVEKEFDLSLEKYAERKNTEFRKCALKEKIIAEERSGMLIYNFNLVDNSNLDIGIKIRITVEKMRLCIDQQMFKEVMCQGRESVIFPVDANWVKLCCIDIDGYTRIELVKSMASIEKMELRTINDSTYGVDANFGKLLLGLENIKAFQNGKGISGWRLVPSLASKAEE